MIFVVSYIVDVAVKWTV